MPAFRVLTNRALVAVADARPRSVQALQQVTGVGPKLAKDAGAALVGLCSRDRGGGRPGLDGTGPEAAPAF